MTSGHKAALLARLRGRQARAKPVDLEQATAEVTAKVEEVKVSEPAVFRREREPVLRHGTEGRPIEMTANYVRMRLKPGKSGVHEYEVRFDPILDSRKERFRCLRLNEDTLGSTRTFDGVKLFLPHKLDNDVRN